MKGDSKLVIHDLQASEPEVQLGLSRAGVQGIAKAIHLRWGKWEQVVSAEIDCTVDLAASQKGVHMSRFPELFEEAIEGVVDDEAFLVEDLAEHVASLTWQRDSRHRSPKHSSLLTRGGSRLHGLGVIVPLGVGGRVGPAPSSEPAGFKDRSRTFDACGPTASTC